MSRIEKIIVMDGDGSGNSATSVAKTVSSTMATVMESVKEMTGFDLAETMKAATYDAQVNRNVTITGLESTLSHPNKLSLDEVATSQTE